MNPTHNMVITLLILFIIQTMFSQNVSAQNPNAPLPDYVYQNEQKRAEMAPVFGKDDKGMMSQPPRERTAVDVEAAKKSKKTEAEKKKTIEEINQKLSPPAAYYTQYADFLKQENTGIARMLIDDNCDEGKGLIVSVRDLERCPNNPQIAGAGSIYSVRLSELPKYLPMWMILNYIRMSDMHLVGNKLYVGNSDTQTVIGEIGEVNFDEIKLKSEAFQYLVNFKASKTRADFEAEKQIRDRGIDVNGYHYSSMAPIKLNSSYVMRSIAFQTMPGLKNFWATDILIAFKIVARPDDGSIIFIWKKLKEKDAPFLNP